MTGAVQLKVNGTFYGGWTGVNITRSIDALAGSFDLSLTEIWPQQKKARPIHPGDACTVSVNGEVVITGYVDDVSPAYDAKTRSLQVSGRDATCDLVDCSVSPKQYFDQNMAAIAKDLCAPYGVPVSVVGVDVGPAFNTWAASLGESVAENLDRMAKHRGVLVMSNGRGGLLLTAPSGKVISTKLRLGVNIKQAKDKRSMRDRYRHYYVASQAPFDDMDAPNTSTDMRAYAEDKAVARNRILWVAAEDTAAPEALQKRANWERNVRAGRALETSITVQGWSHSEGLWHPNVQVQLDDEFEHIEQKLLIAGVTYVLDGDGSRTELRLMPASAFEVLAQPEPGYAP